MNKTFIIQDVVKYSDWSLQIINNDIFLVGMGKRKEEQEMSFNVDSAIKNTFKLGKEIHELINRYIKKKKLELRKTIYNDSLLNIQEANDKIYKLIFDSISFVKNKDLGYASLVRLYNEFYKLIVNYNIDTKGLIPPQMYEEIVYDYEKTVLGIILKKDISSCINLVDYSNNTLLKILEKNKQALDFRELSSYINYTPVNYKHDFHSLMQEQQQDADASTLLNNILQKIKSYCNKYGMPFWTSRKTLSDIVTPMLENINNFPSGINEEIVESDYNKYCDKSISTYHENIMNDFRDNVLPINSFLFICLIIYEYSELWNKLQKDKYSYDYEIDNYIILFEIIGIKIDTSMPRKDAIEELLSYANIIDDYIQSNCNNIYDFSLKKFRIKKKKRLDKGIILYNETIYESFIIAVWDNYFLDYIGNKDIWNPIIHCNNCGKEKTSSEKIHKTRDGLFLCDDCFKKHEKKQNINRVVKCAKKKS